MTKEERGIYFASRAWFSLRENVRARCSDICEHCGSAPMTQVHHKTYARLGNEYLEDLLGVCEPCHLFLSGKTDINPAHVQSYVSSPEKFPSEATCAPVSCPECGEEYCCPVSASCNPAGYLDSGVFVDRDGFRSIERRVVGRGVEIVIGFQCEHRHSFDVVYHFHKGATHRCFRNIKKISYDEVRGVIWRD